jgi:hypothetical protein
MDASKYIFDADGTLKDIVYPEPVKQRRGESFYAWSDRNALETNRNIAKQLGIPSAMSKDNVEMILDKYFHQRSRRDMAREHGLPDNAIFDQIFDTMRKEDAVKLGLPENAPDEKISAAKHEQERLRLAKKCGMPDETPYKEIRRRRGDFDRGAIDIAMEHESSALSRDTIALRRNGFDRSSGPKF